MKGKITTVTVFDLIWAPCNFSNKLFLKQCRSRSAGFWWSQLIRIHTVFATSASISLIHSSVNNLQYSAFLCSSDSFEGHNLHSDCPWHTLQARTVTQWYWSLFHTSVTCRQVWHNPSVEYLLSWYLLNKHHWTGWKYADIAFTTQKRTQCALIVLRVCSLIWSNMVKSTYHST